MLCGALNRGPFVVDGERASERAEEREGEEGWQRASPGGCVETPARTVVTPKSRPHPVWTPTPTPGTIISQRSQRPARRHLCYKRLLVATNQVTTVRALFEITSVGRENVKVLTLNAHETRWRHQCPLRSCIQNRIHDSRILPCHTLAPRL